MLLLTPDLWSDALTGTAVAGSTLPVLVQHTGRCIRPVELVDEGTLAEPQPYWSALSSLLRDALEERVLERYEGMMGCSGDGRASVSLVDERGNRAYAEMDEDQLAAAGIRTGDGFICTVVDRGAERVMRVQPAVRRWLSEGEIVAIQREAEELSDWFSRQ